MDVFVTNTLSWHASGPWDQAACHVAGRLSDGRRIDVLTHAAAPGRPGPSRVAARHAWLHDGVLLSPAGPEDAPRLVVPVDRLSPLLIGEAVRRWLLLAGTGSSAA